MKCALQFRSLVKSCAFVHLSDEVRTRKEFKGFFLYLHLYLFRRDMYQNVLQCSIMQWHSNSCQMKTLSPFFHN